jgi:hypothetical protein
LSWNKIVKVRVKAQWINPVSADTTINFSTDPVTPSAPSVSADDTNNTIIWFNSLTMELAVSTDGWITYWAYTSTLPNLSWNKIVKVRVKAQWINPVSADTTINFSTNNTAPTAGDVTIDAQWWGWVDIDFSTIANDTESNVSDLTFEVVTNPDSVLFFYQDWPILHIAWPGWGSDPVITYKLKDPQWLYSPIYTINLSNVIN